MATFHPINGRISFYLEILAGDDQYSRIVNVTDDGWQIRLKDAESGNTLYVFCPPGGDSRKSDRDTCIAAIQRECGWWSNRHEMFTRPATPKLTDK
jgi:hypothetical protein